MSEEIDLPVDVSELGELQRVELECPDVYYLAVKLETDCCPFPMEYYLVLDGAPISKEAKGYDTEHGINHTLGYKFFSQKQSCVVIFELLQYHSEWLTNGRVDLPALMNAILEYWPEYAVSFNAHEQAGLNDGAGLFLRSMGINVELSGSVERMITLTPGAGIDFLRW